MAGRVRQLSLFGPLQPIAKRLKGSDLCLLIHACQGTQRLPQAPQTRVKHSLWGAGIAIARWVESPMTMTLA
ncbi:hypothetical protein WH5701_03259 [Synechococcus sp. WH 5701]|nr:hypothetical protein WH5701_03259 [Synechococcus sp. WH 5701]